MFSAAIATNIKSVAVVLRLAVVGVVRVLVLWFCMAVTSTALVVATPENSYRVKSTSMKVDPPVAPTVVVVDVDIAEAFAM